MSLWRLPVDRELSERARWLTRARLVTLLAMALLIGVAAAALIMRSVQRQIGGEPAYAKEVVGEIANGNLGVRVALRAGDRDSLLAAMHAMRERLASVVAQVRASSDSIATGSVSVTRAAPRASATGATTASTLGRSLLATQNCSCD